MGCIRLDCAWYPRDVMHNYKRWLVRKLDFGTERSALVCFGQK